MIKAVIFDLDGTLVTFTLDTKACRTKVIQFLTEQGLPSSLFSMKETAFDMLNKTKKHLTTKENEKKVAHIKQTVFSIVENFEVEAAKTNKMLLGIPKTLETLKEQDLKLGLCTISGKKAVDYVLDRFNLAQFFDVVVPRESVSAVKPNSVHLETALKALEVKPQEAVLVGDSIKDVTCAVQLKVIAVGVTTGLASKEQLIQSGAHYVASSVNHVPNLIQQLNKQA
jgi:phosphoglycolate phosphatase-like HAD superfamily hydrolase